MSAVLYEVDNHGVQRLISEHHYWLKCTVCEESAGRWVRSHPFVKFAFCPTCDMGTKQETFEEDE